MIEQLMATRIFRVVTMTLVVVGMTAAGFIVSSALSPQARSSDEPSTSAVAQRYSTNANGQTYGSAGQATSPGEEPELISVIAQNGVEGFVRKSELEAADGTTAMESFTSPEDAVRWQENEGASDRTIPVYAVDGTTVVGDFLIIGHDTQVQMERQYQKDKGE
ncbi:hypothetical protein [Microbacterium sp.]|uniref:hypothetical protein n=1 Tax=Microbacterium sp. TaxID=51671 RepID=UPI00262389B6|nr:hypothetical protein [uncultured Microbacterium sp.]